MINKDPKFSNVDVHQAGGFDVVSEFIRLGENVSEISILEYNYDNDDFEEDVEGENSQRNHSYQEDKKKDLNGANSKEEDIYDVLNAVKTEEWIKVTLQNGDVFIEDGDKNMTDDVEAKDVDFCEYGCFPNNKVFVKSNDGRNLLNEGKGMIL